MLDERLSGLSPFLTRGKPGLDIGLMGAQYAATELVAECRVLAGPGSVQSIPTNADNQDVVSMGSISARHARKIIDNVQRIIAIEMLCAAQAIDLRGNAKLGKGTQLAYKTIRESVPEIIRDRALSDDIEKIVSLIITGRLIEAVENRAGKLA